ncbi:MAG: hypothetical protein JO090_14085 [Rhizobacter sp.]|nr:hypothetical protein [Rhizobacter sp.]
MSAGTWMLAGLGTILAGRLLSLQSEVVDPPEQFRAYPDSRTVRDPRCRWPTHSK